MRRSSINSSRTASLYELNKDIHACTDLSNGSGDDEEGEREHHEINRAKDTIREQSRENLDEMYAQTPPNEGSNHSDYPDYYFKFLRNLRNRRAKPKAFLIFADLDGTFTPMDLQGKQDFIDVVKEIESRCKVKVKFIPVSGRPVGYVLRVLHDCRDMLDGAGAVDCCDYGAAEQGAVIVDSKRSYGPRYMGKDENKGLKTQIGKILAKNKFSKIISDEPDKLFTCSVHIKNEDKLNMSLDEQMDVYKSCRDDIWEVFGKHTLNIPMAHNCMEVMHKEISKARALDEMVTLYSKTYNIVGMCMCGDAENDKVALDYMCRLAEVYLPIGREFYCEIPGVRAHMFTPSNAQKAISSQVVEWWKHEKSYTSSNRIRKSAERLFRGITWLMRDEMDKGTLVGTGCQRWHRSFDDHDMPVNIGQRLARVL